MAEIKSHGKKGDTSSIQDAHNYKDIKRLENIFILY